jgi:Ni/Fe-hydrogenase subunit HybB-like protein
VAAKRILWTVVVLSSLREPLEQWPEGAPWFIAYSLLSGFGMNLLQGIYLVRYGFSSSLALRLGHYLVWHILLGIFVQFVEKAAL